VWPNLHSSSPAGKRDSAFGTAWGTSLESEYTVLDAIQDCQELCGMLGFALKTIPYSPKTALLDTRNDS
jgi:hypothetical protein